MAWLRKKAIQSQPSLFVMLMMDNQPCDVRSLLTKTNPKIATTTTMTMLMLILLTLIW